MVSISRPGQCTYSVSNVYGWDGIIDTDYSVVQFMPWGMEYLDIPERIFVILEGSTDRINNFNVKEDVMAGFALYEDNYGVKLTNARIHESTVRILKTFFQIGLFDNPYLDLEESTANVASEDKAEAGKLAQLKSMVLLMNAAGIIKDRTDSTDLPTVYIPMRYSPATATREASWSLSINLEIASEYFNVITDTFADNTLTLATEEELVDVDFALVIIDSPANAGINPVGFTVAGANSKGEGYDNNEEKYILLSLQYRPYAADSEYVRLESIAGDMIAAEDEDYYGQSAVRTKENRSYFGNTSNVTNEKHLDLVLYAAEVVENVVVVINTATPFVVEEFEPYVDTIVLHFNSRDRAIAEFVAGKFEPYGILPMQMPLNMDTVEAQYEDVSYDMDCYIDSEGNVYDFTFGLNWSGQINDWRVEKYKPE